ncbi:MAG: DNA polymerase III subunit alpha [Myxococcota bacterium]
MAFVHLHNRTQFSLLDGVCSPSDYIKQAEKFEMPAVAITDTCNLYCAVNLYKASKGTNVKPIYGSEIWMWPSGLSQLKPDDRDDGFHLAFLVENRTGYHNLCQLITSAIFDGMHYRPRIDYQRLNAHKEGLIALTCGLNGPIGKALRTDSPNRYAMEHLSRLADIFGPSHCFVELQDFGIPQQRQINELARSLATDIGLQTVITNDCRYLEAFDSVTLDVLNCISHGHIIDDPSRHSMDTDQQYFKSESELRTIFPNDGHALDRTVDIAERCNFKFNTSTYWFPATDAPNPDPPVPEGQKRVPIEERADTQDNWEYFYRAYPPPKIYNMPDPEVEEIPTLPKGAGSMNGYFEWYCKMGMEIRLKLVDEEKHPQYWSQLDYEMRIIEEMGFPAYMLIVAEFINWSKDNGIPVGPGRGSAAGSIVAWAMGITDIDPIKFELLFERFLNPERISMPDIDVDFCQDRREEAIEHVRQKYGAPLVSQIITYGKLQTKAALKDVARAMGLDFQSSNNLAKLIPEDLKITFDKAQAQNEEFAERIEGDPITSRIFKIGKRVEGLVRQTGVHAAGVVIADRPLVEHAPLYRDGPEGGPVVQYDMKSSESVGLIKFDFLGLKTLDQIRDAILLIERNTGEKIDIGQIPFDDMNVYKMLGEGDTQGVFQVESPGMRKLLKRLKPTRLDDVIALIALYRPGPLGAKMDDMFVERRHGRQAVDYAHPCLEPILESSYGTILYQEQVMQIAQTMAGYSLGEADLLRRAMGKKDEAEMIRQKSLFVDGSIKNNIDGELAGSIFDLVLHFAGYGFNRAHSAAYGFIVYQTAWLKAHHRSEYMAALMTIECNNSDKVAVYIADAQHKSIEVAPPNVNHSFHDFDVPKENRNKIQYGLCAIKGAGSKAVRAIIEERRQNGPFKSFMNFLERIPHQHVNKKVLENLIKCGAFDWTGNPRKSLWEALPDALTAAQFSIEQKQSGQMSLFGAFEEIETPEFKVPQIGEWPLAEKLKHEFAALGMYITGHPMNAYTSLVDEHMSTLIGPIQNMPNRKDVSIAGLMFGGRARINQQGNKVASLFLMDQSGKVDCFLKPRVYAEYGRLISSKEPVVITGLTKSRSEAEEVSIEVKSLQLLAEFRENKTRQINLIFDEAELNEKRIRTLQELLTEAQGDCVVYLTIRYPDQGKAYFELPHKVAPNDKLLLGLEDLFQRNDTITLHKHLSPPFA